MSNIDLETIETVKGLSGKYEAGFETDIEMEYAPKGLNEEIVALISKKKNEPQWLLDWRLKAFRHWQTMPEPGWAKLDIPPMDYQDAYYYAAPKNMKKLKSLDEVDPRILETYKKLGIPLKEQEVLLGVEGGDECCVHSPNCTMKGKWNPVNTAMQKALENVSLAQMIGEARA